VWLAMGVPLLDATRARVELGWAPQFDAAFALTDLIDGMAVGAGTESPALRPRSPLSGRIAAVARGRLPGHAARY
jgi:UDP-glucose 4-epimerase